MTNRQARSAATTSLREAVKEVFSRWHRGDHDDVVLIEQDVMLALNEHLPLLARKSREMPCFCGTRDAYRCPAHINPVQFTSGGR